MDYNLKIVIDGVTLPEAQDISDDITKTPSITNVMLANNACSRTMEIGATASDRLVFTVINPEKTTFDGDVVEFYIQENDALTQSKRVQIEEAVGSETTSEIVSAESESVTEENSEDEEPITPEDEADAAETEEALAEGLDQNLEGEFEETTTETIPAGEVGHEWMQVGVYYMYSQVNNSDGSITITAYDGFSKMNGIFEPDSYTATVADMFADLQEKALTKCGITIDNEEFDDDIEDMEISLFTTCTFREAMGYFAGLNGGFAEFGSDGTCGISQYAFDDNVVIDTDLISYSETAAGEMTVEAISCNTTRNALGTDVLEAGSGGQELVFINPFMTQEVLDDIFTRYQGMRFTGAVASLNWDDRMNAGEFIRIFTEDEYANYLRLKNNIEQESGLTPEEISILKDGMNHLGKIILISSQTIDFKGDAVTTITSICDSETTKENKIRADVDAKLMQVYEDNVNTRDLVIEVERYAAHAAEIVDDMEEYAEEAGKTLVQILADGETASALAQQAIEDASSAQASASSANVYANSALTNLGLVENVLDTLTWITEHGYYQLTEDTEVVPNKIYYTVTGTAIASPTGNPSLNLYYERSGAGTDADPYIYTLSADTSVDSQKTYYTVSATSIAEPTGDPSENGYYELDFNSALSQYVSTHLALTDAGLSLINDNSSGSMLLATDGVTIKNANGIVVGQYGEGARIGAIDSQHISIINGQINFWAGSESDQRNLVAYVSNQELHIPRVVVVQSLQMGNWRWDATVENHLSLVWV